MVRVKSDCFCNKSAAAVCCYICFPVSQASLGPVCLVTSGKILLVKKGTEISVLPRLRGTWTSPPASSHIEDYAVEGLRILTMATRELSQAELERLEEELTAARRVLTDRER